MTLVADTCCCLFAIAYSFGSNSANLSTDLRPKVITVLKYTADNGNKTVKQLQNWHDI